MRADEFFMGSVCTLASVMWIESLVFRRSRRCSEVNAVAISVESVESADTWV